MSKCIICKKSTKTVTMRNLESVVPMGSKLCKFKLLKCNFCGHLQKKIDSRWKKSMRQLYSQNYFFLGKHISLSGNKIVNRNQQSVQLIDKALKLKKYGSFLDIGCGVGHFIEAFSRKKKFWNVYAHDLTDLNKKYVLKNRVKNFFTGDIKHIESKFDLISMNHVVEHLVEPMKTIRNVRKLLNKNGYLVLKLPNINKVHTDLTMQDHCSHFNINTLTSLLKLSGFKILKSFSNINPTELFIIAIKTSKYPKIKKIENNQILKKLLWPNEVCNKIKNDKSKKIGLFGIGSASFYYSAKMKSKITFFVDEDPLKINKSYYGKKIYSIKNAPPDSRIYIGIHNKNFASKIKKRISKINKKVKFIVP